MIMTDSAKMSDREMAEWRDEKGIFILVNTVDPLDM